MLPLPRTTGRITYGVKWLLWNPEVHDRFPAGFQRLVDFLTWAHEEPGSTIHVFPRDVLLYIINMCHWEWGEGFKPGDVPEVWLVSCEAVPVVLHSQAALCDTPASSSQSGDGMASVTPPHPYSPAEMTVIPRPCAGLPGECTPQGHCTATDEQWSDRSSRTHKTALFLS